MARSFPADVIVLDNESLLHARFARGKHAPRIVQAKSYRVADDTFSNSVVTPELVNEAALAETLRRLKMETGRWDKASLLLPERARVGRGGHRPLESAADPADRAGRAAREV